MRFFPFLAAVAATAAASKLSAQVPLVDPDAAQRTEAERGYISAMKGDLKMLATAEEAHFMDNSQYFAGTVDAAHPLYGFSPSKNVSIKVTTAGSNGSMWTAVASHSLTSVRCTYHLPDPVDCTAALVSSGRARTISGVATERSGAGSGATRVTKIGERDPARIPLGQSRTWSFEMTPAQSSCVVSGRIASMPVSDGLVNVLVMTDAAYQDWREGRLAQNYFESGNRTSVPFDVRLTEPGRYVLVVANPSKANTKVVEFEQTQVSCS